MKYYILLILTTIAVFSVMSCKNNSKKSKRQEPTKVEILEQKQALADSVLSDIDAFAEEYFDADAKSFRISDFELTEKEKLIKPNYLLAPSKADEFVTKSQKITALAYYMVDLSVRKLYDMPVTETKEAILKLSFEVDHPVSINDYDENTPPSAIIRTMYERCLENGDIAYFWQFQNAIVAETSYIITQNPELFFSKITEEQWKNFCEQKYAKRKAMEKLARYDEGIAAVLEFNNQNRVISPGENKAILNSSIESAKRFRIANRHKYIAKRNALLAL